MDDVLKIANRPASSIHPGATVQQVCEAMVSAKVGALVVLDEGRLVGIISERDVVARLVAPRLDPTKTLVSEIMTREVVTGRAGMNAEQAMELMESGRFRHLPLLDASNQVAGLLSMRHVLRERVGELDVSSQNIVNYLAADGPGG